MGRYFIKLQEEKAYKYMYVCMQMRDYLIGPYVRPISSLDLKRIKRL